MDRHKQHYIVILFLAPCLLDHVRHRDFGVLLKHAGHQAVTTDIVNALKRRAEENLSGADATNSRQSLRTISPTWLMSLVHAAFSWRDGAKRTTENGGPSGGSTTILNSRWLKPWPAALSEDKGRRRMVCSRGGGATVLKNSCADSAGECTAAHSPRRWRPAPQ